MTLQWTMPTIALAACMGTAAAAGEISLYTASDLIQRCDLGAAKMSPYCQGVVDGLAFTGAWTDDAVACALDETYPLTLAEIQGRVATYLIQAPVGNRMAKDLVSDALEVALECRGWRRCMGSGRAPAMCVEMLRDGALSTVRDSG